MCTILNIAFITLFFGAVIEMTLPVWDYIRTQKLNKPWNSIYSVLENPPKQGRTVSVVAPAYKIGEKEVPCRFVVTRDEDHPLILHYRLDVGDMESFSFTGADVDGSVVQYLRDKVYEGNY